MKGMSLRVAIVCGLVVSWVVILSNTAQAQDNYEIQVYSYDTVEPHHTMVELHSNFTFEGSKTFQDRKSTRLNSSHGYISYAVFCLKKKVRERGVRDGQLERRDLEPALPDGEVDGVALVPGRVPAGEARLEPGRGGHDAARLAREVEPGRVAEPEGLRPALHVDAAGRRLAAVEHRADLVEP